MGKSNLSKIVGWVELAKPKVSCKSANLVNPDSDKKRDKHQVP